MKLLRLVVLLVLCALWTACSEDSGGKKDPVDVGEADGEPDIVEVPDMGPDIVPEPDLGDPDVEPPFELKDCIDNVINPLQVGERLFYTCIATGEVLDVQEVRVLKKQDVHPKRLVGVLPPDRLGHILEAQGDKLYYDVTSVGANNQVVRRAVWRVPVTGGDPEEVLSIEADDAGEDKNTFQQSARITLFRVQPSGKRVALNFADNGTYAGGSRMFIYDGGQPIFTSQGVVASFGWSPTGNQIAYVMGGSLYLAGSDGTSGPDPVIDDTVASTGIPPTYLDSSNIVYAKSAKGLIRFTSTGKVPVGSIFPSEIKAIHRLDESNLLVLAAELQIFNIQTTEEVSLGAVPGAGVRFPIAVAPDGQSFLVSYSLDNPFKSFEIRRYTTEAKGLPVLNTEIGTGVISTGMYWQ